MSLFIILSVIITTTKHRKHWCGDNNDINPDDQRWPKWKKKVGAQCHWVNRTKVTKVTPDTITQVTKQVNNIHKGWAQIVKNIWTESQVAKHCYEIQW